MHHFEVSGLAQRARSRGVAQVMDPRVDADIYPFAPVGTDSVIGDRIALALDEFFAGLWARPGPLRYKREKMRLVMVLAPPQDLICLLRKRQDPRHAAFCHHTQLASQWRL